MNTTIHSSRLAAKIAARNAVHQLARDWAPKLAEVLRPFLGKKVLLQGGAKAAKVKEAFVAAIPEQFNGRNGAGRIWIAAGYSCLRAEFECGAGWKGPDWRGYEREGWEPAEVDVTLGETGRDDNILQKVFEFRPDQFRTDFNAEEVLSARVSLKAAQEALGEAKGNRCISYFGEYDN
jgi:hypothetical protein